MEKKTQDKSELKTEDISGKNLDKAKRAKESLDEEELNVEDQPSTTLNITPGGTLSGDSEKANIKVGMNEAKDKSTISNDSAPSGSLSEK
jgi:hypothetical protein